jgi:hypothetical protein
MDMDVQIAGTSDEVPAPQKVNNAGIDYMSALSRASLGTNSNFKTHLRLIQPFQTLGLDQGKCRRFLNFYV